MTQTLVSTVEEDCQTEFLGISRDIQTISIQTKNSATDSDPYFMRNLENQIEKRLKEEFEKQRRDDLKLSEEMVFSSPMDSSGSSTG